MKVKIRVNYSLVIPNFSPSSMGLVYKHHPLLKNPLHFELEILNKKEDLTDLLKKMISKKLTELELITECDGREIEEDWIKNISYEILPNKKSFIKKILNFFN